MRISRNYGIATVLLFITEVFIALYVHDSFVRPYFGDVLVVILIYCFVKTFFDFNSLKTTFGVLLFAYFIEWTQYKQLIVLLGWQDVKLAKTILGNSFSWTDIVAYTIGCTVVLMVEWGRRKIVVERVADTTKK